MSDLDFDQMPFRCFPAAWTHDIKRLLATVAELLTPAQRTAFKLTDVKEKHGGLSVYWILDGDCEPLDPEVETENRGLDRGDEPPSGRVTRLFLDCEWADPNGSELVSLALVSHDRVHSFYAERDPLPMIPTAFVREVVYPLLQRGDAALSAPDFSHRLRAFLSQFAAPPLVLADSPLDFALLGLALNGFGCVEMGSPAPKFLPMLITLGDVLNNIEDYFERNPEARARRHHAGADAEALRWAYAKATGSEA